MDIEIVRTEALKKLGRNVVNFSKIEAALKYLLSISQLELTKETISEQLHGNQARLKKQSLGKLVQEFHKDILVDASQVEATTVSSNSEIYFYFKVTYDNSSFLKIRKRALSGVVAE
jgi:hypothetical protein